MNSCICIVPRLFESDKNGHELITIEYVKGYFPELTNEEAEDFINFCFSKTIRLKMCFGNGSIMYPEWVNSKIK